MSYTHLTIRREEPIEYLSLNRPDVRNALNDELVADLTAWAEHTRSTRDVRVVVLGGAGKVFCAGGDIAWMSKTIDFSPSENLHDAAALSRMFSDLDTLPMPLVGRVQAAALGGGAGLAAICDIVVADDQAVFGFPEVKLGIVPAVISPFVVRKIGVSAARELFLTGARFPATRARELGLVHAAVPHSQLDETIAAIVKELLTSGPEAIAAAKKLIRDVAARLDDDVTAITVRSISSLRVSPEGQEGLKAFLEKRPPSWVRSS
jgi:methylglutaconyl-CoA hydratase